MDGRFSREALRESRASYIPMQKKLAENKLQNERVPDLTDLMNDMFFGTPDADKKAYHLRGDIMDEFDESNRSDSSRLTQDWLDEARRLVASSPSRSNSPSRLVASPTEGRLSISSVDRREPRFVVAATADVPVSGRLSVSSIDRRDPFSRSARRQRSVVGLSEEILTKSAKHSRNSTSEAPDSPIATGDPSPASAVHKWLSNILKPSSTGSPEPTIDLDQTAPVLLPPRHSISYLNQTAAPLPPRQSLHRKSRFQNDPASPIPARRTFKIPTPLPADTLLLSLPRSFDSGPRRSVSLSENQVLSPPRNLVETAHRRSISSSTCALDVIEPVGGPKGNGVVKEGEGEGVEELGINGFLRCQKLRVEKILRGEANGKAKIVLSGNSNSTSSMVAAICYAWLLENNMKKEKAGGGDVVVVPVMNFKREKMWHHHKAAWLFHHVGLDAASLFFANEVDLESLVMTGKLSMLVVGQDVLKTSGKDGSMCTALTNKYCQDACGLLETPMLRKLLLAGVVLDTKNLKSSATVAKDAEAVPLLLAGLSPSYRNALFDQLVQDQREKSFLEVLRQNYGKPPNDSVHGNETHLGHRKSTSVPHQEARISVRKSVSVPHPEAIDSVRKSIPIPHREPTVQNTGKNSKNIRDTKPPKVLPKPAKQSPVTSKPSAASDGARGGKNKSILSKWFGLGSK